MLDQLWHSWSVEGSNNLVFKSKMAKTKPSVRKGPGGMIRREQLATRDGRLPCVTVPRAVTVAEVERNEACAPVCTAAAVILRRIADPVDGEVLEGALGQAFIALDQTDWMSHLWLLRPLGFGLLLRSGLLQATADVCLRFARQSVSFTWGGVECGPKLRRAFDVLLGKSMMREYKRVVKKEGDTVRIDMNVEAGWVLFVKNGGDPKRYHDAVLKEECGNLVVDLIADFGRRHGVSGDALTHYVGGILHDRVFGGDRLDTYHPSEEEQSSLDESEEDEVDEDDKDNDSGSEGGLSDEVAGMDDKDGVTVDKDG